MSSGGFAARKSEPLNYCITSRRIALHTHTHLETVFVREMFSLPTGGFENARKTYTFFFFFPPSRNTVVVARVHNNIVCVPRKPNRFRWKINVGSRYGFKGFGFFRELSIFSCRHQKNVYYKDRYAFSSPPYIRSSRNAF